MQAALFQPFDASRWLKLGFATFLVQLSGAGLIFFSSAAVLPGGLAAWREHAALLPLLLFSIPVVLLLGGSLYLLCLYFGSRASFMTLHMLLRRDYSIANSFRPYARQAASYFFWNTGLFLTGTASSFFLLGIPAWLLADGWPGVAWMGIPVLALAGAAFLLAVGFVQTLASDFVVPLMWRHNLHILQAWVQLLPLLARRLPSFLLYYLAKLAIGLLAVIGLAAMGFFTCCLFFPLALLPVLGQAVLQPVFVFFRLFPLAFLEALAPEEGPFIP